MNILDLIFHGTLFPRYFPLTPPKYVVEAFITSKIKSQYKYASVISSLLWVWIHLYFSINFSYIGDLIS